AGRARTRREHRKQLVQYARKLGAGARVALAGQRPVAERGNGCQRLEPRVERATTVEEGFRHEKTLADPSDITGPRRVRSLSGTRLETGRSAPSAMGLRGGNDANSIALAHDVRGCNEPGIVSVPEYSPPRE